MSKETLQRMIRYLDLILSYTFISQLGLMILSFPIGLYVVYASDLSSRGLNSSISYLLFFFAGIPLSLPLNANVGTVFLILWLLYLVVFLVGLKGPKVSLLEGLSSLRKGRTEVLRENSIFMTIVSFSGLVVAVELLRTIQGFFGVEPGSPQRSEPILDFTSYSLPPITEEFGYRMTLIGLGLMVLASRRASLGSALGMLWQPKPKTPSDKRIAGYLVFASALIFGLAHVLGGWKVGKFSEASLAGYVAGWLYVAQGFQSPVLLHWSFNYLASAYEFLELASGNPIPSLVLNYVTFFLGSVAVTLYLLTQLEKRLSRRIP